MKNGDDRASPQFDGGRQAAANVPETTLDYVRAFLTALNLLFAFVPTA